MVRGTPAPAALAAVFLAVALALGSASCGADAPRTERTATSQAAPPRAEPPGGAGTPGIGAPAAAGPDAASPSTAERDRAFGYFLDSPRPFEVLDQGIEIAEKIRRRYNIDTGNPEADRRAAALKFQEEVLDRIVFTPEEVESTARRLGYSLDPAKCLNACDNVRRLAEIELKKSALQAFAEGRAMPGRVP